MPTAHRIAQAQSWILNRMHEDARRNLSSIFHAEDTRIAPAGYTAAEVEAALVGLAADRLIESGYLGHNDRTPYRLTVAGARRDLRRA